MEAAEAAGLGRALRTASASEFFEEKELRPHSHYETCLKFGRVTDLSVVPTCPRTACAVNESVCVCVEHRLKVARGISEAGCFWTWRIRQGTHGLSLPCRNSYFFLPLLSFQVTTARIQPSAGSPSAAVTGSVLVSSWKLWYDIAFSKE